MRTWVRSITIVAVIALATGVAGYQSAFADDIEQRIAIFWQRIDQLQPGDFVSTADLGLWAQLVIGRNARARLTVAEFRGTTALMQAAIDSARDAPAATGTVPPDIEARIADFWKRIDARQPSDYISTADLGLWAQLVIGRNPRARLTVTDFRATTALMQRAIESAGDAPVSLSPSPTLTATASPLATGTPAPSATTSLTPAPTATASAPAAPPTGTPTPTQVQKGGITFNAYATARTDVFAEFTVAPADLTPLLLGIDADVAQIEGDFGVAFASRPPVYVLASQQSSTLFSQSVMGMDPAMAGQFALVGGYFRTIKNTVVVNAYRSSCCAPKDTPRHELTHMLEHQIVGRYDIPAWFNEGNAVREQVSTPGDGWRALRYQYQAVSAAQNALVPSLATLISQETWNATTGTAVDLQYGVASEGAKKVRLEVGLPGTTRILTLMHDGVAFDAAFQTVVGKTTGEFYAGLPVWLKSAGPAPGIAASTDTVAGPGLTYFAYGFTPSSTLSVSIGSGRTTGSYQLVADPYGFAAAYLGRTWPTGTYTIAVTDPSGRTATTTAVKAMSVSALLDLAGREVLGHDVVDAVPPETPQILDITD